MHLFSGLTAVAILVTPHINVENPYDGVDADGNIHADWAENQIRNTIDFSSGSNIVTWFAGALNQHIIHHLCPNISHVHYKELTKILRQTASDHNLEYRNYPFFTAFKMHLQFLKKLGGGKVATSHHELDSSITVFQMSEGI
jgi:linoleoyl-CoA desaturase